VNIADMVLNKVVLRFVTKDEWHLLVLGLADGLSISQQGTYTRKALRCPDKTFQGIDTEKPWYYQYAYTTGELVKVAGLVTALGSQGLSLV